MGQGGRVVFLSFDGPVPVFPAQAVRLPIARDGGFARPPARTCRRVMRPFGCGVRSVLVACATRCGPQDPRRARLPSSARPAPRSRPGRRSGSGGAFGATTPGRGAGSRPARPTPQRAGPRALERVAGRGGEREGDEPYPRHWSQRLGLLGSPPDPVGRASMRGGPSPPILAGPRAGPAGSAVLRCVGASGASVVAPVVAGRGPAGARQRSCSASSPHSMPSGSTTRRFGPSSTRPATIASMPCARAISTLRSASSAAT